MKPFKKILIASDFSEYSKEALRYGADLARLYDGSVLVVHVYQPIDYALPDGYMMFTPAQMTRMMSEIEQRLAKDKQDALAAGAPRVETSLPIGKAAFEIVEAAREGDCDLIVMGTHGRTGLSHVFLGSTAERVVRTAPCPVLTVRSEAVSGEP